MVGSAFAVLDKSGILQAAIGRIVQAFGGRKYVLLLVIALFFMLLGAFFGIFEEVVPLVPLMIALAYLLGWDSLVGLGMSILATNMGFSAAITNPFTIGVAQKIAGLPLFSGAWLRVLIFIAIYAVLAVFLVSYARRDGSRPARLRPSLSKTASSEKNTAGVRAGFAGRQASSTRQGHALVRRLSRADPRRPDRRPVHLRRFPPFVAARGRLVPDRRHRSGPAVGRRGADRVASGASTA